MERRDRIEKVKNYDMVALASDLGFTPVKVSRNFYTLEEHDSLRIKLKNNTYQWYSTGFYGDTISFAMVLGKEYDPRLKSFDYAINFIEKRMEESKNVVHRVINNFEKKEEKLILPKPARDNKRIYYYLKSRHISTSVIDYFLKNRWLYQEREKNNLVFVSYKEGNPVFAMEKSSILGNRFMREFSGNDYKHCFFINNNSDTLIVTEAVIDMMSLMSLNEDYMNYSYLSINSVTKDAAIYHQIDTHPNIKKVTICLDHDDAGITAVERISHQLKENYPFVDVSIEYPPAEKDWNDYLVYNVNGAEKINDFTIIF